MRVSQLSSASFRRPSCGCDVCWATAAADKPKPITKAAVMRKVCARIVMKGLVGRQARFLLFALAAVMLKDRKLPALQSGPLSCVRFAGALCVHEPAMCGS